jgi:DNA-binding transcriptional regulator YiaG
MYHFTDSGLQNIYLRNGFKVRKTEASKAVAIVDAGGLHIAIGKHIARKSHITGAEFRFLRKELDLSQTRFGSLLDVSEEAVSLWERRGRIPKSACRWMQALYLESVNGNVRVKDLIEQLANLDREQQDKIVFEETEAGWRESS